MSARTVLVVEDDHDIRDMLVFTLQRAGYSVVETEDAEQAMDRLGAIIPEIMLVDDRRYGETRILIFMDVADSDLGGDAAAS